MREGLRRRRDRGGAVGGRGDWEGRNLGVAAAGKPADSGRETEQVQRRRMGGAAEDLAPAPSDYAGAVGLRPGTPSCRGPGGIVPGGDDSTSY